MTQDEARYRAAERLLWDSVDVSPSEQRLRLPRIGTTVRVQEAGQGPPVLFVHGATTAGTSWAPLVAGLAGFRCVLLDRPGCGLSEPRAEPLAGIDDLATFADALIVDVLDALGLERAAVVATSHGGSMALWGEDDPFGDARTAQRFAGYLPTAELELWPGAGHAPWIDDPIRAVAATRQFLDQEGHGQQSATADEGAGE